MNNASQRHIPWLAIDVGGANIKAAHSHGQALTLPFELWKRPDDLADEIRSLVLAFPTFDRVALTMTAELCDCYATKAEGVNAVLDAVLDVVDGRPVDVWGTDRHFHTVSAIRAHPALAAASNWLALAEVAARLVPVGPAILIDIGSTTTDLIPLCEGHARPRGRTDTERLQTGELVYVGVRRTPICALATELPFRGQSTGLMAEFFASTLDIYITLGELPADPTDLSTADGRPATALAASHRLARMVGADRTGFSQADALEFAGSADEAVVSRLIRAAHRACDATVGRPKSAIVSGSGEALARRLAARLLGPDGSVISLRESWGPVASAAACAHALVVLAGEQVDP